MSAAVTPSGVRDGDPAALAGLCAARGPSVVAYCRHVAGDAEAGAAAADAFASFRAAVVATPDPADLDPEALLIGAARGAAARRAPRAQLGVCAVVPLLLAARADRTISLGDVELLEQHLERCSTCRVPVERFEAAERAYLDPPDPAVDPVLTTQIIAAMVAAAPARAAQPAVTAVTALNGSSREPPAAGVLPVSEIPADQPTIAFAPADAVEPEPSLSPTPDPQPEAALDPQPEPQPDPQPEPALDPQPEPRPDPQPEAALDPQPEPQADPQPARRRRAARAAIGTHIPRVRRGSPAAAETTSSAAPATATVTAGRGSRPREGIRSRSRLPLPIVLPVAVVLVALVAALFASGVFGGREPASSPDIAVPAAVPETPPAEVVIVPGAKHASAEDVEVAKARERERARARRKREAAVAADPAQATPAGAPPAAAAPPPAAVTAPPAQAAPPATNRTGDNARDGGSGRAAPGNGGTSAEQTPPAEDSSKAPGAAPAPEPAAAP